jgi:hypothetical protein
MEDNTVRFITSYSTRTVYYVFIDWLNPWRRVLLEKLICSQVAKIFPAFYGTRRFITAFASVCHLFLP